jgi:hypothetical protein
MTERAQSANWIHLAVRLIGGLLLCGGAGAGGCKQKALEKSAPAARKPHRRTQRPHDTRKHSPRARSARNTIAGGRIRDRKIKTRFRAAKRIVAVGDLHGDLAATRRVLRLAGAIDHRNRWSGGKTWLVQTGDQVDKGDADRAVVDLFRRLRAEARQAGGKVISLNGNHEVLNVQGKYLRYVTPGGFRAFQTLAGLDLTRPALRKYPPHVRPRAAAFLPGGPYARILANRPVVVVVGTNVFVHGGLLESHVTYGLQKINRRTAAWMRGRGPFPKVLAGRQTPIWLRRFSRGVAPRDCALLARALAAVPAKRLIVGHTIQNNINSACNGRIWRIDVGMAKRYGGPIQALEIRGDQLRVLQVDSAGKALPRPPGGRSPHAARVSRSRNAPR